MAAYGFSALKTGNVLPAGIANIILEKFTDDGAGADTLDTLTAFRDGKLSIKTINTVSKTGTQIPHSIEAVGSWVYLPGTTAVYEILDALTTGGIGSCVFTLQNGDTLTFADRTGGGASYRQEWHGGVIKWKLVIDGGPDAERRIEMDIKRKMALTATNVPDYAGMFPAFSTTNLNPLFPAAAAADYKPAGFSTFGVRNTGETLWETIGPIRNGKITAELLTVDDDQGRYRSLDTIKIDVEVEVMDTTPTTLSKLDAIGQVISNDTQIVMSDQQTWTFADNLGIEWDYMVASDMQDAAYVKFMASGIIQLSAWDGLVA